MRRSLPAPRPAHRVLRLLAIVTMLAALLAVFPATVIAETFEVTRADIDDETVEGTLRWAVARANDTPGSDTIRFHVDLSGGTITLTAGQIDITDDLIIEGLGQSLLTISGNEASRIFNVVAVSVVLRDLTLADAHLNVSDLIVAGAAVRVSAGSLTVERASFIGNTATAAQGGAADGGAIGGISDSSLVVRDSTFEGNHADSFGGAIVALNSALEITGSTFLENSGSLGGAVASWYSTEPVTIRNTTFSANSAGNGGALNHRGGTLDLIGVTLAGNSTSVAGRHMGVTDAGTLVRLRGTIITGGSGTAACHISSGTIESLGYNLGDPNASSDCNLDHIDDVTDAEADLDALADNGGPTWTHAPGSESDAIDKIPAGDCDLATDQRGYLRPANGACDIGAFETDAVPPAPPDAVSIIINGDDPWTNDHSVSLELAAIDDLGVTRYRLAESHAGLDAASDEPVNPAEPAFSRLDVPFTLTGEDGVGQEVWLRVCDAHDFCVDASDTIGVDTTAPVVSVPDTLVVVAPSGAGIAVDFMDQVDAQDALSGVADGWPQCEPPSGTLFLSGMTEVECTAVDEAGNTGSAAFTVAVVRDWVQACLFAGSLSQVSGLAYGNESSLVCGRGQVVVLEQGADYFGCVFAGSLSQVGTSAPSNCGRGTLISLAAGEDLWGCLYAGSLSQTGTNSPVCSRGTLIGFAHVDLKR